MRLKGKKLTAYVDYAVFKRPDGELVFQVEPIKDWEAFDKIYPKPQPPGIIKAGGKRDVDLNDKKYKEGLATYHRLYDSWIYLTSITQVYFKDHNGEQEKVEWETVNINDMNSWGEWQKELLDSGITIGELAYLKSRVNEINGLSPDKLEEARQSFLADLQETQ